jgi:hypothetical protein
LSSSGSDTSRKDQATPEKQPKRSASAGLWVLVVIVAAGLVGVLSYAMIASTRRIFPVVFRGGPGPGGTPGPGIDVFMSYLAFHVILSTVSIGLLLALIAVYFRTYSRTKAAFILGLLIVLFALLLQNLVTYPLLNPFITFQPLEFSSFGLSSNLADVFTIIAYAAFLYLSLE